MAFSPFLNSRLNLCFDEESPKLTNKLEVESFCLLDNSLLLYILSFPFELDSGGPDNTSLMIAS